MYSAIYTVGSLQSVFRFGYLRVKGCVLLTVAFRSLPRPSSPVSAKASIVRPYLLDHIIIYTLTMYFIIFTTLLRVLSTHSFFWRLFVHVSLFAYSVSIQTMLVLYLYQLISKTYVLLPRPWYVHLEVNGIEPMTYCVQGSRSPS